MRLLKHPHIYTCKHNDVQPRNKNTKGKKSEKNCRTGVKLLKQISKIGNLKIKQFHEEKNV